jgi:hypothetical protein
VEEAETSRCKKVLGEECSLTFFTGRPRSQDVQADPRDDGGQPSTEIFYAAGVSAAQPEPGFLDVTTGAGPRQAFWRVKELQGAALRAKRQRSESGHAKCEGPDEVLRSVMGRPRGSLLV